MLSAFENFDGVTAPALPAGWTQTTTGTVPSTWATRASGGVNFSGSVFIVGQINLSDTSLTSPSVAIHAANTQLKFDHVNNLDTQSGVFFDGGMLEISIAGGAFTDIVTAGGVFVEGGYDGTSFSANTLTPKRGVWGGNSNGTRTTRVNLPASAINQNVQLRWRFSSDVSVASAGWEIDEIELNDTDPDDQISESTVFQFGTSVTETISHERDVDMFAIDVTAGQTITFDVDSGAFDSILRVFDSFGTVIAENDDGAAPGEAFGLDPFLRHTFDIAGRYHIGVSPLANRDFDPSSGEGDRPNGGTGPVHNDVVNVIHRPAREVCNQRDLQ